MRQLTADVHRAFAANTPPGRTLLPDTNFFEAGFTSARLTAVLTELVASGVDLTLVDLFRYPTLAELTDELITRSAPGGAPHDRLPWDPA
jgi:aryl carrier-like protein